MLRKLGKLLQRKKLNRKTSGGVDSKHKVQAEKPEGQKLSSGKKEKPSDSSDPSKDSPPSKKVSPNSLADAEAQLAKRREQIASQGYKPKYSDAELAYMAKHGNVGDERFQVRFMEEKYLNDRSTPNQPLSGKMGAVMEGQSGKGAKYWSTSFDQLEDADTDPRLISRKLGLEYDPSKKYALVVVDTQKSMPLTGVKSIPATFEKVGEFANKELPQDFPKSFTDKAMTPEFQAEYSRHYQSAVDQKFLKNKWSKDTVLVAYRAGPQDQYYCDQYDFPLRVLVWFPWALEEFRKPPSEGGLHAGAMTTKDMDVDGEMLCVQSTSDGYALVNRSRNKQDPISDYDPVDISLSWEFLYQDGFLALWKSLGEKYERGEI